MRTQARLASPLSSKAQILAAYQERVSLRGLARVFGVSRSTISAWLKKVQSLPCTFVGVDETAVFIGAADGAAVTGCHREKGSAEPVVVRHSANVVLQDNILLPLNPAPEPI